MENSKTGIGRVSVCTGFMDSIADTDAGLPRHRNERRNEMNNQNKNNSNSNKYDANSKNKTENKNKSGSNYTDKYDSSKKNS